MRIKYQENLYIYYICISLGYICVFILTTHIYVYSETFMKEREKEKNNWLVQKKAKRKLNNLGKRGTRLKVKWADFRGLGVRIWVLGAFASVWVCGNSENQKRELRFPRTEGRHSHLIPEHAPKKKNWVKNSAYIPDLIYSACMCCLYYCLHFFCFVHFWGLLPNSTRPSRNETIRNENFHWRNCIWPFGAVHFYF